MCFFQTYVSLYPANFLLGKCLFVFRVSSLLPSSFYVHVMYFFLRLDNGLAVWPYGKMFHPKLPLMVTLIMSLMNLNSEVNSSPGDPCFIILHSRNDFYMAHDMFKTLMVHLSGQNLLEQILT